MTFNSWEFLIFYPLVLLLYTLLGKKYRWMMLLVASYVFYLAYQPSLIVLILLTTAVSYASSHIIERSEKVGVRRLALVLTLCVSLGVLFFYKYFDFLVGSAFGIFGASDDFVGLNLMLPMGISFYTFQTLSYVIDVYRGEVRAERNFFFYALYVSFFPQLVAGPIERPDNLIPQLKELERPTAENAARGGRMMLLGFFKKVCVADLLAMYVNSVYNSPQDATGLAVAVATVMFAIQIYCDFSGYTDIAIGCSMIMGVRLMKNFDHPYSATTVKEFWQRWHISLSSWFRDYLYIPLGGNRRGKVRTYLNIFIVFLVSGLWHGAAWTFVLWGALHGVYQIVGSLTLPYRNKLLSRIGVRHDGRFVTAVRRINTFALVSFAWLLFRANSLSDVKTLLSLRVGSFAQMMSVMQLDVTAVITVCVCVAVMFLLDRVITYDEPDSSLARAFSSRGGFVFVVWCILIIWAYLLSQNMISDFIYFEF